MLYTGFVTQKQMDRATKSFRNYVYSCWDAMATSPPRVRPQDDSEVLPTPELQILAWEHDHPVWPQPLLTRFEGGTEEHNLLMAKKKEFDTAFPASAENASQAANEPRGVGRAGGFCDFSVDGGARPLDIAREISLPAVTDADMEAVKKGRCGGRGVFATNVMCYGWYVTVHWFLVCCL